MGTQFAEDRPIVEFRRAEDVRDMRPIGRLNRDAPKADRDPKDDVLTAAVLRLVAKQDLALAKQDAQIVDMCLALAEIAASSEVPVWVQAVARGALERQG